MIKRTKTSRLRLPQHGISITNVKKVHIAKRNPLARDPGLTLTARNAFAKNIHKQFAILKGRLVKYIRSLNLKEISINVDYNKRDMPFTVAMDLDGTLADRKDGWQGPDHFGELRQDEDGYSAADLMQFLHSQGIRLILWTTRGNTKKIKEWLNIHRSEERRVGKECRL